MSHGIIDLLKIINVNHEHHALFIGILCHVIFNLTLCGQLIIQPGQKIRIRLVLQFLFLLVAPYLPDDINYHDNTEEHRNHNNQGKDHIARILSKIIRLPARICLADSQHQTPPVCPKRHGGQKLHLFSRLYFHTSPGTVVQAVA